MQSIIQPAKIIVLMARLSCFMMSELDNLAFGTRMLSDQDGILMEWSTLVVTSTGAALVNETP